MLVDMCRYAVTRYKPRYACFACRKAFKRRLAADVGHHGELLPARCPQCGLLMANMGLDFRAPKQDDEKAWATAGALFSVGITFHSCGCSGPGYRPRDPRALRAFLLGVREEYLATVQLWRRDERAAPDERARALELWSERLAAVESALAVDS